MATTLEQNGAQCLIRMEGEITVACAAELKKALVQALARGNDLRMDLESATELDVTALQLLWVAEREARKLAVGFVLDRAEQGRKCRCPEAAQPCIVRAWFPIKKRGLFRRPVRTSEYGTDS